MQLKISEALLESSTPPFSDDNPWSEGKETEKTFPSLILSELSPSLTPAGGNKSILTQMSSSYFGDG